jgi:hypothetical protein
MSDASLRMNGGLRERLLHGRRLNPPEVKLVSANPLQGPYGKRKIPTVDNVGISRWYKQLSDQTKARH